MARRRSTLICSARVGASRICVPRPSLPRIRGTTVTRRAIRHSLIPGPRRSIVGRCRLLAIALRPSLALLLVRLALLRTRGSRIPGRRRGTSRSTGVLAMEPLGRKSRRSTCDRDRRSQSCASNQARIVYPGHHFFPDLFPDSFLSGPTPGIARTSRFSFPQSPPGRTPR
jgi:hypothetical protein